MSTVYLDNGTYLASIAITANRLVSITGASVTYTAADGKPDGTALTDAASGDYVAVRYIHNSGTQKGTSAVSVIAINDVLYSGALGTVAVTGTQAVGRALTASSVTGQVIEYIPDTL